MHLILILLGAIVVGTFLEIKYDVKAMTYTFRSIRAFGRHIKMLWDKTAEPK